MKIKSLCAIVALAASPAFADSHAMTFQGDVANGEEQFNRQCVACHVVKNDDGETLAGRNGRSGPNLFAMAGRTLGTVDGFRYGKSIVEAGELGAIWTEENFVGYLQDPTNWLREKLDDKKARAKMSARVRKADDAYDIFAYVATFTDPTALKTALDGAAQAEINN